MKIRNPRTGIYDYEIALLDEGSLQTICNKQRAYANSWKNATVQFRIDTLQAWKKQVELHQHELIDAIAIDTGRVNESKLEVELMLTSIDRWCGIAKDFFQPITNSTSSIPFIKLQQAYVAYDLVVVISPWNFPLLLSLIDTIPALLAGCTVVVKPSEVTPRFIKTIVKTIATVPTLANVLTYVEGDGTVGAELLLQADLVCFTGSTATGKKVYDAASKKMIPVFLELGGKDPAVVLAGANIDLATSSILWGSTVNSGQSCLSIERVYVQESIAEPFIDNLKFKAAAIRLNSDDINNGHIGPIIFEKQAAIIDAQLQDAFEKGAVLQYGNKSCEEIDGGFYCQPTVLTNVNHSMKIMQEETFGPIIPIMTFKDEQEAITLANDTMYGLSGAVFAKDNEAAMQTAQQIVGGAISINDCALTAIMHEGEKNSFKLSGIGGTRMGVGAIKRFVRQKVFIQNELGSESPWWFR